MTNWAIDSAEFYPVYTLDPEPWDGATSIELTDEERADYDAAWQKWTAWQQRLGEHINAEWDARDAKP